MQRRAHLLAENKSTAQPRLHIFVDVESQIDDPREGWRDHHFQLGWALFWRRRSGGRSDQLEWYKIESPVEFWEWVERHVRTKTRLLLVAHNVDYDLLILRAFFHLPRLGWELQRFYLDQGCKILNWRKGNYSLQVVDNVNWFKGQLATWAKAAGIPKLDTDPLTASADSLSTYCRRDVDILHKLWEWWYGYISEHDCGAWGITLPSQAFHAFRHRHLNHKVWIHDHEDALELERESYHGGRTECFRYGEYQDSIFYKLDVNSMYPFCMWAFETPLAMRGYTERLSLKALQYRLQRYCLVARATVNVTEPFLPFQSDDGLIYPIGRFETVLTTPELRMALERGWLEELGEAAWYRKGILFRDYVDYWYALKQSYREDSDPLLYRLSKMMLNSLYGKFGQLNSQITQIGECHPEEFKLTPIWDTKTSEWITEYRLTGKVFVKRRGGESFHSFPAIAAHVTAYARMYLYRVIELVGREHVYYCDTDSIIVDSMGFQKFAPHLKPSMLGHLKVERIARFLKLNAPKDYQMDGHVVLKGVRPEATWLDDHTVKQEIFPTLSGLLKYGKADTYATRMQVKRLERVIRSGVQLDNGYIDPYEIDLDSQWGGEPALPV